jgi:ABC-type siderophore export system fused ATPase/permease subunit
VSTIPIPIPKEDWPALLSAIATIVVINAAAYLAGITVIFWTVFAVPVAITVGLGVNYLLHGRIRMSHMARARD